jgi:hypothetical protein
MLCPNCPITKQLLSHTEERYREGGLFSEAGDFTKEEVSYFFSLEEPLSSLIILMVGLEAVVGISRPSPIGYSRGLGFILSHLSYIAPRLGGGTKLPKKVMDHIISNVPCTMENVIPVLDMIMSLLRKEPEVSSRDEPPEIERLRDLTRDLPEELLERVGLKRVTERSPSEHHTHI